MKRHIPGLHHENRNSDDVLEGVFLVRVDRAFYRWHPQRPFFVIRFAILEPKEHQGSFCHRPALLHTEGSVEAQLVPAGLRL